MMWDHGDWMINGHHWMWGWFMPFGGFPFILLLVVLFVVLLLRSPHRKVSARSAALHLLEERYAKGEIEREEYLQKKADLGG
jgi:putative membrane protein